MPNEPNVGWTEALGEHGSFPQEARNSGELIFLYEPCTFCEGKGAIIREGEEERSCTDCKGSGKSPVVRETHRVSSDENRIKAHFEQWVRGNAKKVLDQIEAEDGPEEAAKFRSRFLGDVGAGHYNWDGRIVRSAKEDYPGVIYLLYLCLKRCNPEMTTEKAASMLIENRDGCIAAMKWALSGNSRTPAKEPGKTNQTTKKPASSATRNQPLTMD